MGMLDWGLFRTSLIKKVRFQFSSVKRQIPVIMISETGNMCREFFEVDIGYMTAPWAKMSWLVQHEKTFTVIDKHGNKEHVPITLVSERSYLPLDPLGKFKRVKEDITPLNSVAKIQHAIVRASLAEENNTTARDKQLHALSIGCLVLAGLIICFWWAMKMWGGG